MWKEKRKSQEGKKGFHRKKMGTDTDRKEFFYGWYFRCQGKDGSAAVIPAVHLSPGHAFCSVQILTEHGSLYRKFPMTQFRLNRKRGIMQIGKNRFGKKGIHMNFEAVSQEKGRSAGTEKQTAGKKRIQVRGVLRFGTFTEPKYDIMGPFAWIPGMQCRHAVYSMKHSVNGWISLDGKRIVFRNGLGYMEGDSGTSFPDRYLWSQQFFPGGSLMAAVATVPFAGKCFTGILALIFYQQREYRLATYLGASVKRIGERELLICQGKYRFQIRFRKSGGNLLKAPEHGRMVRRIREDIGCRARSTLIRGKRVLLDVKTDQAAAEYEGKKNGIRS